MAKQNTAQRVEEIISPYAKELGLEIWDVRFAKEGSEWFLRIFIDKQGGVGIDDCVDLTHAISGALDEADPISQAYTLEVSSPGVERELTRKEHFLKNIGSPVMLRTVRAIDGVRDFKGELASFEDNKIKIIMQNGEELCVDKKETAHVKLDDFDINDFI